MIRSFDRIRSYKTMPSVNPLLNFLKHLFVLNMKNETEIIK